MELFENKDEAELALLVSLDTGDFDCEASVDELEELAHTAGAKVFGKVIQSLDVPNSATFIGTGKLEEIADICEKNEISLLIFDSELSPIQQRNIEQTAKVRTIDRTTLILDIFAARARSSEGKIQVELAQLRYALPRLTGHGVEMSRLGGGIGTRGPGETKLESDKRHIRRRIAALEEQLEAIEKRRSTARQRRKKDGVETVAIVGYTNAGKSTLMNTLTQAGVLAEDKLFATLDPTSRALTLPDGRKVMMVDTVGLIRRLPHKLVEAFKSTLEEAVNADVILNVCDASSPFADEHIQVTQSLLAELGCGDIPVLKVLNKCDMLEAFHAPVSGGSIMISAKTGEGLEALLNAVSQALPPTRHRFELLIPFSDGAQAAALRKQGQVEKEEYRADGLFMQVILDVRYCNEEIKKYSVREQEI